MKRMLVVAAGLALAACSSPVPPPAAEPLTMADARRGQQLAETYCSSCHAIDSDGASAHAAAPPFRTFSRNYSISALAETFAEGALVGHPDMPQFTLEPDQIDALLAYIYTVQEDRGE